MKITSISYYIAPGDIEWAYVGGCVQEIKEVSNNIYDILYLDGSIISKKRVFNPCTVGFKHL